MREWHGKAFQNFLALETEGEIGDWYVSTGGVWLWVPTPEYAIAQGRPTKTLTRWPYVRGEPQGGSRGYWGYNGNPNAPTLKPSLFIFRLFHGRLVDGVLQEL